MKRCIAAVSVVAASVLLAGCGGGTSGESAKTAEGLCNGTPMKSYNGHVIVTVSGGACARTDGRAVVIARGHATVDAHGHSVVDADDQVTVIVHNTDVRCLIRGRGVVIVDAVEFGSGFSGNYIDKSCKKK
jgi:hypothetical protein